MVMDLLENVTSYFGVINDQKYQKLYKLWAPLEEKRSLICVTGCLDDAEPTDQGCWILISDAQIKRENQRVEKKK